MAAGYEMKKMGSIDAVLLKELSCRTFSDAFGADNNPSDLAMFLETAYSTAQLSKELADPQNAFWLYEENGQPAGYLMLQHDGGTCLHLERIYLCSGYQGRGAGKILMEKAVSTARDLGCSTLQLGVWQRNARAIAFYEREGFRITGETTFLVGSDPQSDWIMVRPID